MEPTVGIYITEKDYERLSLLIQHSDTRAASQLEEELARAKVVPQDQIPKNIVTMNSKVRFKDEVSDKESEVTLVYPQDADVTKSQVSILAPVGLALIGLKEGQSIEWPMPNGVRKLKVVEIIYQPEAAQNWDQ